MSGVTRRRFIATFALLALGAFHGTELWAQTLRVLTSEEAPTSFIEDGRLTGITVEIVKKLAQRLSVPITIEVLPWARAIEIAQRTPNVVLFTAAKTPERQAAGFSFIGPVTTRKHALFARAANPLRADSLAQLRLVSPLIASLRGDWRAELVRAQGFELYRTNSHVQSLRLLLAGRVDLAVLSDLEMGSNLKMIGAPPNSVRTAFVLQEREAYILISKGTAPEIVADWQHGFALLQKTDFFQNLAARWTQKLGLPMDYKPDQGLHIRH